MTTEMDVGTGTGWIERRAKLFQAGEYPDKGIAVYEEDLIALVDGFKGPAPVLIEHAESPLQLGFLTEVRREGRELHGTIQFSPEADALVRRSGARGLSLGLSPDLRSIREVSLVRRPRVEGAALFSGEVVEFSGELLASRGWEQEADRNAPSPTVSPGAHAGRLSASNRRQGEVSPEVSRLVREGRMAPAQVPFAEALLACEGVVEFSGDRRPLRELLIALLERQPPLALFGQTAPVRAGVDRPATMLPEEAAFYERHFPGVPLTMIAEAKGA